MDKQKHKEDKDEKDESREESEVKEELVREDGNTATQKEEEAQKEDEEAETEEGEKDEEEDEKQGNTETQNDDTEAQKEEVKRTDILRRDLNKFVRDNQPSYNLASQPKKLFGKSTTFILFILAVVVIGGGIYFMTGAGSPEKGEQTSAPIATTTPQPTPAIEVLNRSEWSFEVLNGSGVTGEAKRIAGALGKLGYQVVKTGNADRDDYSQSQFFVRKDLEQDVNQVVVDIKDIIKIASISGELKDSTASARIIIGK